MANKIKMTEVFGEGVDQIYFSSESGMVMLRKENMWTLIDWSGNILGSDMYRYDLAERFNIDL